MKKVKGTTTASSNGRLRPEVARFLSMLAKIIAEDILSSRAAVLDKGEKESTGPSQ